MFDQVNLEFKQLDKDLEAREIIRYQLNDVSLDLSRSTNIEEKIPLTGRQQDLKKILLEKDQLITSEQAKWDTKCSQIETNIQAIFSPDSKKFLRDTTTVRLLGLKRKEV